MISELKKNLNSRENIEANNSWYPQESRTNIPLVSTLNSVSSPSPSNDFFQQDNSPRIEFNKSGDEGAQNFDFGNERITRNLQGSDPAMDFDVDIDGDGEAEWSQGGSKVILLGLDRVNLRDDSDKQQGEEGSFRSIAEDSLKVARLRRSRLQLSTNKKLSDFRRSFAALEGRERCPRRRTGTNAAA